MECYHNSGAWFNTIVSVMTQSHHVIACDKERVIRQQVEVRNKSLKMPAFKAEKLRVNLRLTINRLKLLEKKKSE